MRSVLIVALLAVTLVAPAVSAQEELTPEKIAKIRRDEKAAMAKVQQAHGNKKSSEMSNEERRQLIAEQGEAAQSALQKNGVSTKDYATYTARMSPDEQKAAEEAEKKLEAQEQAEAAKKAAEAKKAEGGEVQVQQGFSEENPVDLEEKEGAPPKVEYLKGPDETGTPPPEAE